MNDDDFISLKVLIASEAAAEREMVRQAALQSSVPIDVADVEGSTAACELLGKEVISIPGFAGRS